MVIDTRKDRTKLVLRDAMIELLSEKSFDQISTTELVKRAKISRSSFYTHYQDKYDMIEAYQRRLFETIQYVFEKNNGQVRDTLLETFEFLQKNQIYAVLLSENGSKEIQQFMLQKLKDLLQTSIFPQNDRHASLGKLGEIYATTYYSNAIFGLTQSWLRRNQNESPAEIADLLMKLIY
jgi:AcrR family transcriptional regulator